MRTGTIAARDQNPKNLMEVLNADQTIFSPNVSHSWFTSTRQIASIVYRFTPVKQRQSCFIVNVKSIFFAVKGNMFLLATKFENEANYLKARQIGETEATESLDLFWLVMTKDTQDTAWTHNWIRMRSPSRRPQLSGRKGS